MAKCKYIKRLFPATLAWTLLVSTTAIFFLFPCRRLHEEFHYSITVVQAIITFFVISNFFCTTFFDPGIIKRALPDEDVDDFGSPLFKEVIVRGTPIRMKWCATCQFYRPPRCSHCSVCDNCIETFDHHCPWVNNCIGRRNYRHFFFFLIFLTIHMITIFIWCLMLVLNNKNKMHETPVVVAISLMVFISVVFIPIFGLTVFHIILVARGRTTNEQVTGKFDGTINPFSRGIFLNCLYTLCGPRFPGVRKSVPQKDVFDVNEPGIGATVYMDNIPMDVQNKHTQRTDLNDIMLERLDRAQDSNSMNASHSREQLSRQLSSPKSQEMPNFPNDIEAAVAVNGTSTKSGRADQGGRHVVTMQQTENGTKETTFIALSSSSYNTSAKAAYSNSSSNGNGTTTYSSSSSNPAMSRQNTVDSGRPGGLFTYHPNNKISASPAKSTSINEISSHAFKRSPVKRHESQQGPEGGMVIYYSPDAGVISNSKYSSESELQKYGSGSLQGTPLGRHQQQQQQHNHHMVVQHQNNHHHSHPVTAVYGETTMTTTTTATTPTASSPPHHLHFNSNNYEPSSKALLKQRPLPFLKALEMSNKMEKGNSAGGGGGLFAEPNNSKQQQQPNTTTLVVAAAKDSAATEAANNRQSTYEMNYEISV